jgi:hypothetical protein
MLEVLGGDVLVPLLDVAKFLAEVAHRLLRKRTVMGDMG